MNIKELQKSADLKMAAGCNCCESILWGFLETNKETPNTESLYRVASIFGGGIVNSRKEICGALTGALMVLSVCEGRVSEKTSNDALMEKGAFIRSEFQRRVGPTICEALREKMIAEHGETNCRRVVQQTIEILSEVEIKTHI